MNNAAPENSPPAPPASRWARQRQLLPQQFTAGLRLAGVANAQALAIVRQQRENVRPRPRPLADEQRLQQAEGQQRHTDEFQQAAADANRAFDSIAMSGPDQRQREGHDQDQNRKQPTAGRKRISAKPVTARLPAFRQY